MFGFMVNFLSGNFYPADKKACVLQYKNKDATINSTKQYAGIYQLLNDKTLPESGEFELTERMYYPLMKIFGFCIYNTDFHLIGIKCKRFDLISLKKCIKEEYTRDELDKF